MFQQYIDKTLDGILWIELKMKNDHDIKLLLCVCYLPPEGSSRGNIAQEFYDTLLSQIYMYYDDSPMLLCGDYNARIGSKIDWNNHELVTSRTPLDTTCNRFGDIFLEFLRDSNTCVLRGRHTDDNYTCVSSRGRSVVDYIVVPKAQLNYTSDFRVNTVTDACAIFDITPTARAKAPDHSQVTCALNLSCFFHFEDHSPRRPGWHEQHGQPQDPVHRRYRVNILPNDIFQNDRCVRVLSGIIDNLYRRSLAQKDIDDNYEELIDAIHSEMDSKLEYGDYTPGTKKCRKRYKPYWNDELALLWSAARDAEREYLRFNGHAARRRELKKEFVSQRDVFDKRLRQAKRSYEITIQTHIQGLNTQNPREFWREINKLGPSGSSNPTPESVRLANGDIISDTQQVLEKWKDDFKQLYDSTGHTDVENEDFLAQVERLSSQWEVEYQATLDATNPATTNTIVMQQASEMLNRPITLPETINAIKHTKDGKAVGIDNVDNEILKVTALQECLHRLYAACFEHSLVPAKWYLGIIHPILKKGTGLTDADQPQRDNTYVLHLQGF